VQRHESFLECHVIPSDIRERYYCESLIEMIPQVARRAGLLRIPVFKCSVCGISAVVAAVLVVELVEAVYSGVVHEG